MNALLANIGRDSLVIGRKAEKGLLNTSGIDRERLKTYV